MNGMFNSTILDVVVGLIFVYLLLAVICSTINEWVAAKFDFRAKNLKAAISQMLDRQPQKEGDTDTNWFLNKFNAHPLIAAMHDQRKPKDEGHPSYLPSRAFATAVMDLVTPTQAGTISFHDLQKGIEALPPGDVRTTLLAVIQNADEDITKAQKHIETWFDDTMERVGGWYKSKMQIWTIVIAVVLTISANADTIRMTRILWRNPTVRAQIVESSKIRAGESAGSTTPANAHELSEIDDLLGWGGHDTSNSEECWRIWLLKILGLFLTIVAVSLGAPFWFDLLNKVVNLRNAGNKPKTGQQQTAAAAGIE
jgi:hypothetical protein